MFSVPWPKIAQECRVHIQYNYDWTLGTWRVATNNWNRKTGKVPPKYIHFFKFFGVLILNFNSIDIHIVLILKNPLWNRKIN